MASTFLAVANPLIHRGTETTSFSTQRLSGSTELFVCLTASRRNFVRVSAIATKFEPSKVIPQADRVLIRLESLPEKSSGGVLLPKSAVKFERYLLGEVLSVGADVEQLEAGKKVLFSDINAYEVDLGSDAKHCFCKAGDLLAVVE
ncbi:10 kDa chaperonin 1, chloroplastic-like [Impatiens glandulifera]|uniref:10 kDa chaperonin 1, chloroplastic-like n=1 Tax=Impatiens glandulifera TaxID=253017 RepID=UPI001FB11932|nr:10 kDa chaperonin 1, chloroplastic-like [Impatiens glandulifera]